MDLPVTAGLNNRTRNYGRRKWSLVGAIFPATLFSREVPEETRRTRAEGRGSAKLFPKQSRKRQDLYLLLAIIKRRGGLKGCPRHKSKNFPGIILITTFHCNFYSFTLMIFSCEEIYTYFLVIFFWCFHVCYFSLFSRSCVNVSSFDFNQM